MNKTKGKTIEHIHNMPQQRIPNTEHNNYNDKKKIKLRIIRSNQRRDLLALTRVRYQFNAINVAK